MVKQRRLRDLALGLFLLAHPGPVLLHLIAVSAFAISGAWPHLLWRTLFLVIAAHAAMQLSIAMVNDYCDRNLDALSKPGKPLVRGLILPREALAGGVLMLVLMLVCLLFLPPLALWFSLGYLALGQAYNLGLKATPWSGALFALAFPLIPLYTLAGVNRFAPTLLWIVPVAFLMGVAINIANSLPDLEEDLAGGARTLAVALGVKRAFLVSPVLVGLAAALMAGVILLGLVPAPGWVIGAILGITGLAVGAMVRFFGAQQPPQTRKAYFYLVAVTCLVLGIGWVILVIG